MKKQLTVALGLAVLATPAFASKARLAALGEDKNGSFYINDNRNIFLNASEVNNHKDLVTYEYGEVVGNAGTAGNQKAEAGVFLSNNNMVYGAQLGRDLSFNDGRNDAAMNAGIDATNAIDLFVAGDAGMKWGAQVSYAKNTDEAGAADNNTSVMDLSVGVTHGDISGYVKAGINGKAEAAADEIKRSGALDLGVSYKWDNYTAFAQYAMNKFEKDSNDEELANKTMQVGVGRNHKLNDKATLYTKVAYVNTNTELDVANTEDKQWDLPLTVALEYDAASWLALRGFASQSLQSKVDKESTGADGTNNGSTNAGIGASFKFGELALDGVIGNSANLDELNTDTVMSKLSMTYRF